MKTDLLQRYRSLQAALQREREEIVARLREIDAVLGQSSESARASQTGRRGRGGNPMPLRDAVLRVTANRPMTKQEIYEAVLKLGYRFTGKDPLNVLGVVLYGKKPRFKNEAGRFSPEGGAASWLAAGGKTRRAKQRQSDGLPAKRKRRRA